MHDTMKIAVAVERTTLYGRNLLRGLLEEASGRPDWELSLMEPGAVAAAARRGGVFDGWICRVTDASAARALARTGRPVVDCSLFDESSPFAFVRTDAARIGALGAEHLLSRRYPAYAWCGLPGVAFSELRREAFAARLAREGHVPLVYAPALGRRARWGVDTLLGERLAEAPDAPQLRLWARSLPKPVAVFCSDDLRASQLLRVCRDEGLAVPSDVAILGVDDDPVLCLFASPRLSSVDNDSVAVGRAAAAALARMLDGGGSAAEGGAAERPSITVPPRGVSARASTDAFPGAPQWLPDVLSWIESNAGRNLSACDVFARAGRSRTHVEKAFRDVLGTTVQKKIAAARIDMAKKLLRGSVRPVSEIAAAAGFGSAEYFSRLFAAAEGLPPAAWREREACALR